MEERPHEDERVGDPPWVQASCLGGAFVWLVAMAVVVVLFFPSCTFDPGKHLKWWGSPPGPTGEQAKQAARARAIASAHEQAVRAMEMRLPPVDPVTWTAYRLDSRTGEVCAYDLPFPADRKTPGVPAACIRVTTVHIIGRSGADAHGITAMAADVLAAVEMPEIATTTEIAIAPGHSLPEVAPAAYFPDGTGELTKQYSSLPVLGTARPEPLPLPRLEDGGLLVRIILRAEYPLTVADPRSKATPAP
ncbi:hypothetical protein [Yinghuangia soli]|uniref:Uncharacterized protein n=1 Tax=Yinghuangia soli TaxID=2908204 RepID=A0AA41Q130_9ACTN|nr:hypothetical protein [Yinghuangia soli]MCF2529609.1 hypothetical protein [Yinghuangia soli]